MTASRSGPRGLLDRFAGASRSDRSTVVALLTAAASSCSSSHRQASAAVPRAIQKRSRRTPGTRVAEAARSRRAMRSRSSRPATTATTCRRCRAPASSSSTILRSSSCSRDAARSCPGRPSPPGATGSVPPAPTARPGRHDVCIYVGPGRSWRAQLLPRGARRGPSRDAGRARARIARGRGHDVGRSARGRLGRLDLLELTRQRHDPAVELHHLVVGQWAARRTHWPRGRAGAPPSRVPASWTGRPARALMWPTSIASRARSLSSRTISRSSASICSRSGARSPFTSRARSPFTARARSPSTARPRSSLTRAPPPHAARRSRRAPVDSRAGPARRSSETRCRGGS